ncbi:pentapeptide repeat-containing protein [Natrinema sp. CGMCC1.2065]|uniref:pentapeptide repeat-containing protein n=1 Tax=Natrinema sp. CGMCC1.2065 TaxID=3445767 RepID=UPI003F49B480
MDRCGEVFQWSAEDNPLYRDTERSGGRITSIKYSGKKIKNHCCYRKSAPGSEKCYWHTESEKETADLVKKLQENNVTIGNIYISGEFESLKIDGAFPGATFENCTFKDVDFSESILPNSYFANIDLADCKFERSILQGSNLHEMSNQEKSEVNFKESDLRAVTFSDVDFEGGNFQKAIFNDKSNVEGETSFDGVNLQEADLEEVEWQNVDLTKSDLTHANLQNADFSDGTLAQTIFSHANCLGTIFSDADLEGAKFDQAYLVGSDFTDAEFHNAVLADVQIDHTTEFDDLSSYQRNEAPPDKLENRPVRDLKALWTYRTLQTVFRENGMIDKSIKYYIQEKDLRRKQYWEQHKGNPTLLEDQEHFLRIPLENHPLLKYFVFLFRAIRAESSKWIMKFGEGITNLTIASLAIILVFGVFYPVFGLETQKNTYAFSWPSEVSDIISQSPQPFLDGLLFSIKTFTPSTTGDIVPFGFSQVLVIVESSLGAIFIALVVFVLGRRATR